jgi:hypothetical protein
VLHTGRGYGDLQSPSRLIPAKALASLLIGYVATKVALRT